LPDNFLSFMEHYTDPSIALLTAYIDSFHNLNESQIGNFAIKKEHSLRVAKTAEFISHKLELNKSDSSIAKQAALFHDIGRFWQLSKYNTFDDSKSGDHAGFSVEILKREGFLKTLGCNSEKVVHSAIFAHNKFKIPENLNEKELLHAKILRDADKLDILDVLTRYYSQSNTKPNHSLTWELSEGYNLSENVEKDILNGKMVQKKDVFSEIDVKIMQLSWIYDLNFKCSIEYALRRKIFQKIYNSLPQSDTITDIYRKIKEFGENQTAT
jgi:putative nucleotidyltransferase with HDIG domain